MIGTIFILIVIIMSLSGYSFISPLAQKIFYVLYIFISIYLLYILRKKENIRLHHIIITVCSIILFIIIFKDSIIAFPLLFIFPMLSSKQSHIIFKGISWITYIVICLFFCLTIFVRFGFTRTYISSTEISPDKKRGASTIIYDQGALGGSLEIQYERLYGGIIKKSRPIYWDRLSEPKIEWIGNDKIKINDEIIDVNNKDTIYRRK